MTLDDLLSKFKNPREASEVAELGRTAAWHWFAKGEKRSLPSVDTVVRWADHFGLTDTQLGMVIRDRKQVRAQLHQEYLLRKDAEVRQQRAEAAQRSRDLRKEQAEKRRLALQALKDKKIEQEVDWEEKEKVLEIRRLENIIKGDY